MARIQRRNAVPEIQGCGTDEQVLKGDAYTTCSLFTLKLACKFGDFERYRINRKVTAEFFGKSLSTFTIRGALGSVDTVSPPRR